MVAPDPTHGVQSSQQLEIRFSDLTVTYKTPVVSPSQARAAKPYSTIGSVLKDAVMPPKTQHREVLKGVSGVLRPSSMTLVLGQPGSGKSTFLKALSGQLRPSGGMRVAGSVTYNGEAQTRLQKVLPQLAAYVPQQDQHFSMLTVQETFAYAQAFNSRRDAAQNAHDMSVIQAQLGLQNCWNTIVGDGMARGVSGGEKKRVTTGEMLFGDHRAAFMDEISTGLDSVTTFDIVNAQRVLAKTLSKTVVISLLQPTPEVYALFDDVIVFHDGEVVYYGPTGGAAGYFRGVGLECPPDANVADFLLDIGTAQQRKYERHQSVPRSSSALADHFRKSDQHHESLRQLERPWDPVLLQDSLSYTRQFQQSLWANALTIARRQLQLMLRDTVTLRSRAILVIVIAVFNGTTFLDIDPTDVVATLGGIFAAAMFLAFEQTSQLAALQTMRDVFYKQRGASFFQTAAYVLGNTLSQVVMVVVEVLVYGTIAYWITGYEADAARFFLFLGVLICSTMAAVLTFFCVTAASPSVYFTVPAGLAVLQIILGFSGLVIPKSQIPDYLVWLFWINPITWAFRALAVNFYRSTTYDVCVYDGVDYCSKFGVTMSEYFLELSNLPTGREWIVYGVVYLLGYIFVLMVVTTLLLEYQRYDSGPTGGGAPLTMRDEPSEEGSTSEEDATGEYGLVTTPRDQNTKIAIKPKHRACAPVTLAFKDLWYSVPNPQQPNESIDLLKGVTGYARPGTMTALMGSSGAGKTTLLDVIAGRKNTGVVRGDILLNGHPASKVAMRRATGYCEQMGIHSATATVREALTFSAFLRQGSDVPDSAKYDSVDECLELLGLDSIANHLAGSLSLEQSKRLTIGVELAAQPSVLFLDEPTSGLDARSAKLIMDSIRSVADSGRTIICTIHQPSLDVFSVFDNLLLLQRGGQTVFFGDLSDNYRTLVTYFEAMPSVSPLPTGYNPATWMLECIGAGVDGVKDRGSDDFPAAFQQSELKRVLEAVMEEEGVGRPSASFEMLQFESKHAATGPTQMKFLLLRFIRMYWRTPAHYVTMFGTALGAVIVFGLAAIGLDTSTYHGLMSALGVMFVAHEFQSYVSFNSAIPFAIMDRAAFYREQSAHTYHTVWYWLGMTIAEIPYVFAKGLIVAVGLFLFMGFTGFGKFVLFWLASSLGMLVDMYMGQLLAFLLPTMVVATLMGSVVGAMAFIYVGFLPPGGSIPSWYQWFYTINPLRYAFPSLVALVYADCPTEPELDAMTGTFTGVGSQLGCQPLTGGPVWFGNGTVKMFVESAFDMKHQYIGRNFGVLILCAVVLRVATLLLMRFVNHQKR